MNEFKNTLRTNKEKVVKLSILVEISHPVVRMPVMDGVGNAYYFPGVGGITYNFGLGDNAFSMHGDHIEPDLSTKKSDQRSQSNMHVVGLYRQRSYCSIG